MYTGPKRKLWRVSLKGRVREEDQFQGVVMEVSCRI